MMTSSSTSTYKPSFPVAYLSLSSKPKLTSKRCNPNNFKRTNRLWWTTGSSLTTGRLNHLKNYRRNSSNTFKARAIILFSLIKSLNNSVFRDVESMMWSIFFKVWMLSPKKEKIITSGRVFMRLSGPSTSVKKTLKTFYFQISKSKSRWNIWQVVFSSYFLVGNPPFLYKKLLNILWNKWMTLSWKLKSEDSTISSTFSDP